MRALPLLLVARAHAAPVVANPALEHMPVGFHRTHMESWCNGTIVGRSGNVVDVRKLLGFRTPGHLAHHEVYCLGDRSLPAALEDPPAALAAGAALGGSARPLGVALVFAALVRVRWRRRPEDGRTAGLL